MVLPDFRSLIDEAAGHRATPPPEEPTDARILDAALKVVAEYGERRLTMEDVATAAKVSRATVFRRFGSKDGLLGRLYAREVRRALGYAFAAASGDRDPTTALIDAFVALGDHVGQHPVIRRMARAEPELLVELWRSGEPPGVDVIVAFLVAVVAENGRTVEVAELRTTCDLLARLLFGELLLPPGPARQRASRRAHISAFVTERLRPSAARAF